MIQYIDSNRWYYSAYISQSRSWWKWISLHVELEMYLSAKHFNSIKFIIKKKVVIIILGVIPWDCKTIWLQLLKKRHTIKLCFVHATNCIGRPAVLLYWQLVLTLYVCESWKGEFLKPLINAQCWMYIKKYFIEFFFSSFNPSVSLCPSFFC